MKNIVAIVMVLMSFFVSVELGAMDAFTTPEKNTCSQPGCVSPQKKEAKLARISNIAPTQFWRNDDYESSEGEPFEDDGKDDNYSDCRKSPAIHGEPLVDDNQEFCCIFCQGYIEIILDCGHSYCSNCASFSADECPACFDSMS